MFRCQNAEDVVALGAVQLGQAQSLVLCIHMSEDFNCCLVVVPLDQGPNAVSSLLLVIIRRQAAWLGDGLGRVLRRLHAPTLTA